MAQIIIPKETFMTFVTDELNVNDTLLNPKYGLTKVDGLGQFLKGGETFTWPISNNIGGDWTPINDETTTLNRKYIDQKKIVGIAVQAGDTWSESEANAYLQGDNLLKSQIIRDLAKHVVEGSRQFLIPTIKGAFNSVDAAAYKVDLSGVGSGILTDYSLIKTVAQKFPKRQTGFMKTLVVHALVYAELAITYKMEYLNTETGALVAQSEDGIPKLFGYKVVVDNDLCAPFEEDGITKYPSYLCAENPFTIDYTRQPTLKSQEQILLGGGTMDYALYMAFFSTFHAASWKGATGSGSPTTTALALGTNWEWKVFDSNNVKAIQILSILPTE